MWHFCARVTICKPGAQAPTSASAVCHRRRASPGLNSRTMPGQIAGRLQARGVREYSDGHKDVGDEGTFIESGPESQISVLTPASLGSTLPARSRPQQAMSDASVSTTPRPPTRADRLAGRRIGMPEKRPIASAAIRPRTANDHHAMPRRSSAGRSMCLRADRLAHRNLRQPDRQRQHSIKADDAGAFAPPRSRSVAAWRITAAPSVALDLLVVACSTAAVGSMASTLPIRRTGSADRRRRRPGV
jgi:hypothetical protein